MANEPSGPSGPEEQQRQEAERRRLQEAAKQIDPSLRQTLQQLPEQGSGVNPHSLPGKDLPDDTKYRARELLTEKQSEAAKAKEAQRMKGAELTRQAALDRDPEGKVPLSQGRETAHHEGKQEQRQEQTRAQSARQEAGQVAQELHEQGVQHRSSLDRHCRPEPPGKEPETPGRAR